MSTNWAHFAPSFGGLRPGGVSGVRCERLWMFDVGVTHAGRTGAKHAVTRREGATVQRWGGATCGP